MSAQGGRPKKKQKKLSGTLATFPGKLIDGSFVRDGYTGNVLQKDENGEWTVRVETDAATISEGSKKMLEVKCACCGLESRNMALHMMRKGNGPCACGKKGGGA